MKKHFVISKLLRSKITFWIFIAISLLVGTSYHRYQQILNLSATSSSLLPIASPITEYLTYTNDRYGYSFSYPNSVTVVENIGQFEYFNADPQSKVIFLLNNKPNLPSQSFGIEEVDLPPGQTMKSYVEKVNNYKDGYFENSGEAYDIRPRQKVTTYKEFFLDGKPAIKLISEVTPDQGSTLDTNFQVWILYQPGKLLSLGDPMVQYHALEFDENILSSLHFFEPSPELAWIKHAFSVQGFAFSLPPDWEITPSSLASFPEFSLYHDQLTIQGHFGSDGSLGQKAYLEDWKKRPDARASYHLFSDYSRLDNYEVLASIKTPSLFILEAFVPLYNGQNLILSIDDPTLELTFYRFLNTLSRLE